MTFSSSITRIVSYSAFLKQTTVISILNSAKIDRKFGRDIELKPETYDTPVDSEEVKILEKEKRKLIDEILSKMGERCKTILKLNKLSYSMVEISQKPPAEKGFVPQTGRWQVERSFAWLNNFRRLSKEYGKTIESSVVFIQIAYSDIILARNYS